MEARATASPRSPVLLRYRNRDIREEDLQFIRATIAGEPGLTRTQVALAVCDAWNWRQFNGRASLHACYDLLRRLEEWGHIQLPSARWTAGVGKRRLPHLHRDLIPLSWSRVDDVDADLRSVVVRPIAPDEREGWRLFIDRYHYLGYRPIVGENLLYVAVLPKLADEVVALLGWASAAFHSTLREEYIGWDEETKRRRQHLLVNNVRFLVPHWVRVPNLASRVLGLNLRRLSADWQKRWGHPVYLAETFVDTSRFRATCYRASNWLYLGHTSGYAKQGNKYLMRANSKAHYVYPLHSRALELLCQR